MKKRRGVLMLWLLLPIPVIAFHFGPGRLWQARDEAGALADKAAAREKDGNWSGAAAFYRQAAAVLGAQDPAARAGLELRAARAQARDGDAAGAIEGLDRLLADPSFDALPDGVQKEARVVSARAHYYAAWVMRLEGAPRDEWMEVAESSRQNFRLLAEAGGEGAADHQRSLESVIRLERMSLTELMAKPLPEEGQCMKCKNLCQKMGKCKACKKPGRKSSQPQDVRNDPQKGAGISRWSEGGGS